MVGQMREEEKVAEKQRVLEAVYSKYLKVVRVELVQGEYEILKGGDMEEVVCLGTKHFWDYIKKMVETGNLYEEDVKDFLSADKLSDLQKRILQVNYNITKRIRYRVGDIYEWMDLEIIAPQEYTRENPWVYFVLKNADQENHAMEVSMYSLSQIVYKILKVNLTQDSYEEIKSCEGDYSEGYVTPTKISVLLYEFAEIGNVHPEDLQAYYSFTNTQYLQGEFYAGNQHLSYRYRRKVGEKFQWVSMDWVKGAEYTEENQIVLMYIRDISDIFQEEQEYKKTIEYYCYHDILTGLGNRAAYEKYCREYQEREIITSIGVVFADANNLKQINDKYGHTEGDEYLKNISQLLIRQFGDKHCYRISGDEFVVIMEDIEEEQFVKYLVALQRVLDEQDLPIISMGSHYKKTVKNVEHLMRKAETKMYKNKAKFYVKNPHVNRRRQRLAEMENVGNEVILEEQTKAYSQRAADRIFEIFSSINDRDYLYMIDLETGITRWSPKAVEYWGLDSEYVADSEKVWKEIVHPDDYETFCKDIGERLAGSEKWEDIEYRLKNKNGNYVICTCRGLFFRGENGEPDILAGMIINHGIVDNIDPVTSLHNEEALTKRLQKMIEEKSAFFMLKIRIDTFTNLKVLYGFSYGNRVLKKFTEELLKLTVNNCKIYRLEGPDFVLLGEELSKEEIQDIYEKVKKIAAEKIILQSQVLPIRVSAGALIKKHARGTASYLKSCVTYAAERSKTEDNGELVFYEEETKRNDENTLKRIGAIHQSAINDCDGFYLCYQPVVDAQTGKIAGAEALLRWKKEPYGNVSPGLFIQWLEEEPYFYELGNWILRQALKDAKKIKEMIPEFVLNVNVSSTQLLHPEFREAVLGALEENEYSPSDLCLELTERCRNLNLVFLHEEVLYFQSKGIKMAIDDFGTGSASLNILLEVPVDEVKLDMSFVRGIQNKPLNQAVVGAIIQCTKQIGIMTCVEGVEDKELMEYLERYHATFYQGYYFARPLPLEEFMELVMKEKEN